MASFGSKPYDGGMFNGQQPMVDPTTGILTITGRRFLDMVYNRLGGASDGLFETVVAQEQLASALQQIEDLRTSQQELQAGLDAASQFNDALRSEVDDLKERLNDAESRTLSDLGAASLAFSDSVRRDQVNLIDTGDTLSGNISVSSTSYVVIAGPTLTDILETDLVWILRANAAFQTAAASADTAQGQWAIYLSDTEIAANSAISTAVTARKVWEGDPAGLTFATFGTVSVDANDLATAFDAGFGKFPITPFVPGVLYEGTGYVYLCLKVTSGGGESINIASGATTRLDAVIL
jgi:regulator of replication initiation timing